MFSVARDQDISQSEQRCREEISTPNERPLTWSYSAVLALSARSRNRASSSSMSSAPRDANTASLPSLALAAIRSLAKCTKADTAACTPWVMTPLLNDAHSRCAAASVQTLVQASCMLRRS